MKGWKRLLYLAIIAALLATFLLFRRTGLVGGTTSTVDAVVVAALLALALLPAFRKVTVGGVTLEPEVKELIQREVSKAQAEALRLIATRDLEMMPIWERDNSSLSSGDTGKKLELIERHVLELEQLWKKANSDERPQLGLALREVYWAWLEAARHHWASSQQYQEVRHHVENGFSNLAGASQLPSR